MAGCQVIEAPGAFYLRQNQLVNELCSVWEGGYVVGIFLNIYEQHEGGDLREK